MISLGPSLAMLIGGFDILLGVFLLAASIYFAIRTMRQSRSEYLTAIYIIQIVVVPISLVVAGAIFVFQGWRLDPLLLLAIILLHSAIILSALKDFVLIGGP
jgi:uncharacterized membrane protein